MNKSYLVVGILFVISVSIYLYVINNARMAESTAPVDDHPVAYDAEDADVVHVEGWAIVPKMKQGERVYWFIAPDENGVSPGVFRKTIHGGDDGKQFTIVSECEAPKQTCDRLMQQFETLSEQYN